MHVGGGFRRVRCQTARRLRPSHADSPAIMTAERVNLEAAYLIVSESKAKDWSKAGLASAKSAAAGKDLHRLVYELVWHAVHERLSAAQLAEALGEVEGIDSLLADTLWMVPPPPSPPYHENIVSSND